MRAEAHIGCSEFCVVCGPHHSWGDAPTFTVAESNALVTAFVEAAEDPETPWIVLDSISVDEEDSPPASSMPPIEGVARARGWLVGLGVLGRSLPPEAP